MKKILSFTLCLLLLGTIGGMIVTNGWGQPDLSKNPEPDTWPEPDLTEIEQQNTWPEPDLTMIPIEPNTWPKPDLS